MPALPSVEKVVRVDMIHEMSADLHLGNRTFWTYTGSNPTVSNMSDLAGFFEGFWNTNLKPMCSAAVSLVEIVTTDLTSPTASRGTWAGSVTGTRSGNAISINDVALINFGISRRYRGGKPRIYAPWGVDGDLLNAQQWTTGFVAAANSAWTGLHGSAVGQGFGSCAISSQVNVSYYEGFLSVQNPVTLRWRTIPTLRTTPLQDLIDTFECSQYVGSQRRRIRA